MYRGGGKARAQWVLGLGFGRVKARVLRAIVSEWCILLCSGLVESQAIVSDASFAMVALWCTPWQRRFGRFPRRTPGWTMVSRLRQRRQRDLLRA